MSVNITTLIEDFSEADLAAYIQNQVNTELQHATYFPSVYRTSLSWKSLQGNVGLIVAGAVVGFGSSAPIFSRPSYSKISSDMPKIQFGRQKDEVDFIVLADLQRAFQNNPNEGNLKALMDWIYEDSVTSINGVKGKVEYLAKRAASTGQYSLSLVNNAQGISTKAAVGFGLPNANITSAAVKWNAAVTGANKATPITDIRNIVNAAKKKGFKVGYITTDQDVVDAMMKWDEVKNYCASFANIALNLIQVPTLDMLNTALRQAGLPQIRVWESVVGLEAKDGTITSESGWEPGAVTFSVTPTLGDVQWTNPADQFVQKTSAFIKYQSDYVTLKVIGEEDPIIHKSFGTMYGTPVLQNANSTFILNTF